MVVADQKSKKFRPSPVATEQRRAADAVLERLEGLCATLQVGERLPSHPELMRRFDSSERAVREALDTLQRQGRIVRRQGSGTYIASSPPVQEIPPALTVVRPSIVAVAAADYGFFDRSVGLICREAEGAGLDPIYRPISSHRVFVKMDVVQRDALAKALMDVPGATGFIVFSYSLEPLARSLADLGGRVVLFGTPYADSGVPHVACVCGDQEYGGYMVTRRLIHLGHRRLAFLQSEDLSGNSAEPWRNTLRWRGHQRALNEARRRGADILDSVVSAEVAEWKANPAKAADFFRSQTAPTALVCWNDLEAVHMLSLLARAGVRVPDQVSVVGYDDMPESARTYPALTTVDPSVDEMIRIAVDLVTRPDGPEPAKTVLIPKLVERDSVAPPP